jgi:hypothetical protein
MMGDALVVVIRSSCEIDTLRILPAEMCKAVLPIQEEWYLLASWRL